MDPVTLVVGGYLLTRVLKPKDDAQKPGKRLSEGPTKPDLGSTFVALVDVGLMGVGGIVAAGGGVAKAGMDVVGGAAMAMGTMVYQGGVAVVQGVENASEDVREGKGGKTAQALQELADDTADEARKATEAVGQAVEDFGGAVEKGVKDTDDAIGTWLMHFGDKP